MVFQSGNFSLSDYATNDYLTMGPIIYPTIRLIDYAANDFKARTLLFGSCQQDDNGPSEKDKQKNNELFD